MTNKQSFTTQEYNAKLGQKAIVKQQQKQNKTEDITIITHKNMLIKQ